MRSRAVAAGALSLFALPANAEPLRTFEIYQHLQGDWATQESSSTDVAGACAMARRRLSLDVTGLVLNVNDLDAHMTIRRSYTMQLKAIPEKGDAGILLEFFGPDVDHTSDQNVWQRQDSVGMRSVDRMHFYSGYAPHPPYVADRRGFASFTPHGYGADLARCSPTPGAAPSVKSEPP